MGTCATTSQTAVRSRPADNGSLTRVPAGWPKKFNPDAIKPRALGQTFQCMCLLNEKNGVYDGDTVKVVLWLNGVFELYSIRLSGIDSPELKPLIPKRAHFQTEASFKNAQRSRVEEVAAAKRSREAMKDHLRNVELEVEFIKNDKYGGRFVGNLWVVTNAGRENVSDWMIEQGHAWAYDGKKKTPYSARAKRG